MFSVRWAVCFALVLQLGCEDTGSVLDASTGSSQDASVGPLDATPVLDSGVADSGPGDSGVLEPDAGAPDPELLLLFTGELTPRVQERLTAHLRAVSTLPVRPLTGALSTVPPGSMILSFGDRPETRALIPEQELGVLGSEGFIIRSGSVGGVETLAVDGNAELPDRFGRGNIGLVFGAYGVLEELGFAFLHPLAPSRPMSFPQHLPSVNRSESPRWPIRGMQIHTMHPLELTQVLNGWGDTPADENGFLARREGWESTVEWLVANRQNRVHWVLLHGESWGAFAESTERRDRLAQLTDVGHAYALAVGVDVPIALGQQHAFRLVRDMGDIDQEKAQIRARLDYVMSAGFDYVATEAGTSEFTHPEDTTMLSWMNEFVRHLDEAHQAPGYIKIHTSTGQTAPHFPDPDTGEPINFNFLPHFADPRLGVMPHTVQHYGLDDPAPTYGNSGFAQIREFLAEEAGARPVLWHPESAYWVSFDIDVPLFLPLYAERRFHDLRLLAADEAAGRLGRGSRAGSRMDGQIVFSSGWEWGYWLNDVVAARAAWDPMLSVPNEREAYRMLLQQALRGFGTLRSELADWLIRAAEVQREQLILGKVGGVAPADIVKRNGQAYLQGYETWDEVSELAASLGLASATTQPEKLGMVEMRNPLHEGPGYSAEIEPLLAAMERSHGDLADEVEGMESVVPAPMQPLLDDLVDSARITALRAKQVHGLYDYVDGFWDTPMAERLVRLNAARSALDEAATIVERRERAYRVPADRIGGWFENPTAYEYGYLWTVRTLYYWWRDEGKAVDAPVSPCYLNVINPLDVGFGEGMWADSARVVRDLGSQLPAIGSVAECLAETRQELVLPPDGLRSRP